MTIRDSIIRSGRNLRTAKVRTILTAMAIGVGAFTLALTLAAGNGVRDYTDKLVASNYDPAELFVGRDPEVANSTGAPSDEPQEYDESVAALSLGDGVSTFQLKRVTQEDVEELRSLPYIEQLRENYQVNVRYITAEGQKRYTAGAQVYNPAQKPELAAGKLPENGDINKGQVLLPDSYLAALGFKSAEAAIGKTVQVNVRQAFSIGSLQTLLQDFSALQSSPEMFNPKEQTLSYVVGGVTKRPATSLAFGLPGILLSNQDARSLYEYTAAGTDDYEKYIYVFARIKDGQNEDKLLAAKADLENKGYYVQSSKDVQKAITQFVNIMQAMVAVFGLITLVASVFGVINTQYISVLERTREIGLMKALGMRSRDVRRLFIIEAAWIGFIGGFVGATAGFILGVLLNPWITRQLELGEGNSLIIFNPIQMIILILALMGVAAAAGFLPARKAAKMNPIEALRSE